MKKSTQDLQAVIFDMDGTLIDTEAIGAASWEFAGQDLGVEVPLHIVRSMVGRTLPDIHALVRDAVPGIHGEALFERANFHYHRLISAEPPALKAGAKEVLDYLHNRQIPLALATSSRASQAEDKLGRTGLRAYFSYVVAGDEVANGKPHPEIFQRAAAGLGVEVTRCVCVEDSGPGVRSAAASGAVTVFVPEHDEHDHETRSLADHVLPDLFAAVALFQSLLP